MPINPAIIKKFEGARLGAVADALLSLSNHSQFESLNFDGRLLFVIDFILARKKRKQADKMREEAQLPHPCAEVTDFDYKHQPDISKAELRLLLNSVWSALEQHQVITGAPGENKLKMACGIANRFLDKGTSVKALSLKKLLFDLRISLGRDLFKKKLSDLNKIDLLLISDWQIATLELEATPLLSLFIESRKCPLLITSNLTQSGWDEDLASSKLPVAIKEMISKHSHIWQINESFKQKLH